MAPINSTSIWPPVHSHLHHQASVAFSSGASQAWHHHQTSQGPRKSPPYLALRAPDPAPGPRELIAAQGQPARVSMAAVYRRPTDPTHREPEGNCQPQGAYLRVPEAPRVHVAGAPLLMPMGIGGSVNDPPCLQLGTPHPGGPLPGANDPNEIQRWRETQACVLARLSTN